ncbi:hypothetical protein NE237_028381 [Protea cynaroides]|uniref:Maternal effect embryo arrest 60 n=1 Tax=Protea cynaroides TaxID=273540 RepID=A0A9Q0GTP1_9MAGN|nr:hypothetical protein NE237_028381 [Protea cynaroides]
MEVESSARPRFGTSIHITAIDGIVNVNSLFTLAVFIGLAWNPTDLNNTLVNDPNCVAGRRIAEDLVSFHVYSFSSFLFSSIIALSLKQAIRIAKSNGGPIMFHGAALMARVNKTALRVAIVVSAAGSVSGCVFLMLALVNVVQIKLGILSCGSVYSYGAVVPLFILVPVGLLIYVCMVLYALTA